MNSGKRENSGNGVVESAACFAVLGVVILLVAWRWESSGLYPLSGDQPHYLVLADAVAQGELLSPADAYQREFAERVIYPDGLGGVASPLRWRSMATSHLS